MTNRLLLIVVLCTSSILLLSCWGSKGISQPKISKTETGNILIATEDFSAVILSKEFLESRSPRVPTTYWTPEDGQVLFLESNLEEFLAQHNSAFNSGHAPNKAQLSTYGRQYIGIVFDDKHRGILGVFFCPEFSKDFDWKNQVVTVKGGGDCFFGVWYDPDTQKFIIVAANSPE